MELSIEDKKRTLLALTGLEEHLLPRITNEFSDINKGGCGVFAWLLWKKLKSLNIPNVECRVLIYEEEEPEYVEEYLQKINQGEDPQAINDQYYGFTHMILSIKYESKYYLIDSESVEIVDYIGEENPLPGHLKWDGVFGPTLDFNSLELLANNTKYGLWNQEFDRDEVPVIAKMIEEFQLPNF